MTNSDYEVGTWLIHKQTKDLFEIVQYLSAQSHTGPDRCLIALRSKSRTKYSEFNLAINIIKQDFDLSPAAHILYSK